VWGTQETAIGTTAGSVRRWAAHWEAVLRLLSRFKIRRKAQALRLSETLALGDRRMLAIVEWRGQTLLLGVTPEQITLLETKHEPSAKSPAISQELSQ